MVSKAPGSFSPAVAKGLALRDSVAHDLAGAEGHDAPRSDRHFDARLWVAADALALVAQDEGAESRHLDVCPFGQRVAHVVEHALDHARRLGARQPEPPVNDV